MKFADLKTTLKTNISPVYLIHGTDIYLVNKAIELIIQASNANKELDISRLDDAAATQTIEAECRTVSFLGGKRVVIVKPFTQEVGSYIKAPNPDCILILVSRDEKTTLKNIETIDCNPMPTELLVKLIANQLSKTNLKITPEAALLLCNYCSNTYSRIDGELNKLSNYFAGRESIGTDEINQIVTKTQEHQIYELANAILGTGTRDGQNAAANAEQILRALQDQGADDYLIFASVVSALRRIYYSLTCKSPNETVAAVLGCSPYAVNYARRDYKPLASKIGELYDYALDLEYQIKSGKISVHNAIVLCYAMT